MMMQMSCTNFTTLPKSRAGATAGNGLLFSHKPQSNLFKDAAKMALQGEDAPPLPGSAGPLGLMTHHSPTHPPPPMPALLGDELSPHTWHLRAGRPGGGAQAVQASSCREPGCEAPARAVPRGAAGTWGLHCVQQIELKCPRGSFGAGNGGCSFCLRSPETLAGTLAGTALLAGGPPFR